MTNRKECTGAWREQFPEYLHDQLEADAANALRGHLAVCPACEAELDQLRGCLGRLDAADPMLPVPARLTDHVMARILLDQEAPAAAVSASLTERTLMAVLSVPATIRKVIPLRWQLLRSTLAATILATVLTWMFLPVQAYTQAQCDTDMCHDNLRTMGKLIRTMPVLTSDMINPLQQIEGAFNSIYFKEHDERARGLIHIHDLCSCPSSKECISYVSRNLTREELQTTMPSSVG